MRPFDFAHPALLVVAAVTVCALGVGFALDFTRRRRALARAGGEQLRRMAASVSHQRRVLKATLVGLGVALVIASIARPQTEGETIWRRRGIDAALVLDFSRSMLARDAYPNRLAAAKRETEKLMEELAGDRIAVVAFAGAAVHFPLTHDHTAARLYYESIHPRDLPAGSSLGAALTTARCVVRPDLSGDPACNRVGGRGGGGDPLAIDDAREGDRDQLPTDLTGIDRARAIVVLTDGEAFDTGARAQVERARAAGIEVFFVGVGSSGGELIPELDEDGNEIGWKKTPDGAGFVTTRLEQGELLELAQIAGGPEHYVRLGRGGAGVGPLVDLLQKLKKGDLDERVVKTPNEAFHWLLFPAFVLLLIEACMTDRRRIPGGAA